MKRWLSFAFGFCFCALIVGVLAWKATNSSGITTTEEYYQKIRNGLAEINLPKSNDQNLINAAPDSLSNFIHYRSGVQISTANKNALRSAEQNAWNDSKRVDAATLAQIMTDMAVERIPTLSDSEITAITESLRGFNAPDLPESFQRGRLMVKLRASGQGRMPANEFSQELTKMRNGDIQNKVAQNLIYVSVSNEVNRRIDTIRKADPEFFGGTQSEMTPMQALLLAYSVVADDDLAFNRVELEQRMQNQYRLGSQSGNRTFPAPNGHKAYGDNGYRYSAPVSIILNDASVARFLTLVQERGR
ncbi:MAG: hypothetical protein AB1477_00470 [Acidobacteriota bacterium]